MRDDSSYRHARRREMKRRRGELPEGKSFNDGWRELNALQDPMNPSKPNPAYVEKPKK